MCNAEGSSSVARLFAQTVIDVQVYQQCGIQNQQGAFVGPGLWVAATSACLSLLLSAQVAVAAGW